MKLPNPHNLVMTNGVKELIKIGNHIGFLDVTELNRNLMAKYDEMPDKVNNGRNDKFFFSFDLKGVKVWAVANEVDGLTVMLPEEY